MQHSTGLDADLFVHSAFPTQARDAAFFGPDIVRFFKLICDQLPARQAHETMRIADIGCGSGGGDLGRALSVKVASQALQRLRPGARLILYTEVAMVQRADHFIRDMEPFLGAAGRVYTYAEIDPDVFGEELTRPVYQGVDRIAAVGLVAVKS